MAGYNKVTLLGYLGKDPELRYTTSGKAAMKFQLGCGYSVKRGSEWVDETDWVPCEVWEKRAEAIARYCVKGSQLLIDGSFKTDNYKDKDGKTVWRSYVQVKEVRFAGGKRKDEGSNGGYATPAAPASTHSSHLGDMPGVEFNETADIPF